MGLFDTFKEVSHQDWLDKITLDLKGKDFNDTLVWKSREGIDVQPFYNQTIQSSTPIKTNNDWKIRETIVITDVVKANKNALLALSGGANSILFIGEIKDQLEMDSLINNIQTDIIEVHFYNSNPKKTSELINLNQGSISYDSLTDFNIEALFEITNSTSNIKTITIKHNTDSITKELAYNLSKGVEYINLLTDKGIKADKVAKKMQFTFGIGTNYFFEIAKLRAARKLWEIVLTEYGVENISMSIHSETSKEIGSTEDFNYDILRNTTKAMSAIVGGCDSLTVNPHDDSEQKVDFSNRIARNIHHILKEESFFSKVKNPADGAYYIEELTEQFASKAWKIFQEMETNGGYLNCINSGFLKKNNTTSFA
jgi:methylmalonyl-CoA mutase